ncbi:MAG: beta-ketoacyl synthase N-terminal-like domain-containing protein [Acidimicrobiales bacterium]
MLAEIRALRRRAVVTGIGVLTGPVVGADAFWTHLADPTERPTFTRLEGFRARDWLDRREARHTDRFAQVGLAAAVLAAKDADLGETDPLRTGVVMGTGGGSAAGLVVQELDNYREYGAPGVSPLLGVRGMSNAGTAIIALQQQAQGETMSISSGCASGTHAVGHGMRLVQLGLCDVVYAGSAEVFYAPPDDEVGDELSRAMISGLANMKVLTDGPTSRPFDVERDGFVCADGAAVLIIEERERALARGAHIYCEVCGYGNTNDAGDLISPRPDGALLREAMRAAVIDAGGDGGDVRFVNVHGTATRSNDLAESLAIAGLCGRPG